ncbi:DUF5060 domain-containing protein [Paraglaciecola aquimarina]|uniref:DUF5060 domain-containing protein n=1 Tax=Paraglaciecola aquimarina TaxID=1235557 RepID=A0ABU3SRV4_9ALTE|nr:DUF5060 domain-containing protein [Paraglaciecola aquimarina]MDU0352742.1 DUF5060 domain-containing protein [Paraglaciecola aquimarina]
MKTKVLGIVWCATLWAVLSACSADKKEQQVIPIYQQWHTVSLSFIGNATNEQAQVNPFTDTRLLVRFTHQDKSYVVRGFYAADGDAANTSADSGSVWQVRFNPDEVGEWQYQAYLHQGKKIAISRSLDEGTLVKLKENSGRFKVVESDKKGRDFRAKGKLIAKGRYLGFSKDDKPWLKVGTNSPENFLAYVDFDDTYRGELEHQHEDAPQADTLHAYAPHAKDWQQGDITWGNAKGKNIIGATNYLASMGMNSVYFLTMNIGGDGKDVWPYTGYEERERFDVSKLEQWNLLFEHMQQQGLALHIVTQETENETMLDGGDLGFHRQLYYQELIARFGHHLALIWDLGEENGPVDFSPIGQTPEQRRAMARYFVKNDPYAHPVYLHTHASEHHRQETLPEVISETAITGLSFQVDQPVNVHQAILSWRKKAQEKGNNIQISMDEIGIWQEGLKPDADDPEHNILRQQVLWGSLMAGASGTEWYFGYNFPHNDLSAEDWRSRHNMWQQTSIAEQLLSQFQLNNFQPQDQLTVRKDDYVLAEEGKTYLVYLPSATGVNELQLSLGAYTVQWFNPRQGGALANGTTAQITTSQNNFGLPSEDPELDWLAVISLLK